MKITRNHDRYEFCGTYNDRDVPKEAGFRWDAGLRTWYTESPKIAAKLIALADDTCRLELLPHTVEKEKRKPVRKAKPKKAVYTIDQYRVMSLEPVAWRGRETIRWVATFADGHTHIATPDTFDLFFSNYCGFSTKAEGAENVKKLHALTAALEGGEG